MDNILKRIVVPVILCGGAGSRLWPLSRENDPKPFIRLDDGQSLIQKAFTRGAKIDLVTDIITVTNRELFFRVEDDYNELKDIQHIKNHFILEPFGRNTAPAIAAACLYAKKHISPEAILLILAADHLILNQEAFETAVRYAANLADEDKIVTFGITPNGPETGYGYIEHEDTTVVRFVEKPDFITAKAYVDSKNFLWNSGMFCFSLKKMLDEMALYCPHIMDPLKQAVTNARFSQSTYCKQIDLKPCDFEAVPSDSIDYAIMEKTKDASVVACDIGWSDIGCWRSLGDLTPPDAQNNRVQGEALVINSTNCTIVTSEHLVGAVGVNDLVIIDTPDALLVSHKNATQDVKTIFNELKMKNHETHKLHVTAHRPWGTYTVLEEGHNFKIKRIEVKPSGRLSLQMHHHRSEHWIVVSGTAKVFNGDKEIILKTNESTFIPATHKHRLENAGIDMLCIIEVQTGTYLGEDDIVRFEDNYGRV